ncbi:protein gamma response 1 [Diospyros lotus]|uniref:protein gamma response 1 n=1 Tax=Diospyros lotus TaxID=55363 RepID=UPI002252C378|nr:protein gamma response 1 [Diospyros lotus]XP_052210903.1 protein gamma response 1 [Diospyros lotus]
MEDLQKSPQLGYPVDGGDAKYVSGLSTILVATIQEAKDRISQIEYIFCSQLFPNFQSKSKSLQKIYTEARKAAEDAWKEKEKVLLVQIEELQLENKLILQENQSLKLEKKKFLNLEGPLQNKIFELQEEVKQRTEELAESRENQANLLRALETKASLMVNNEKTLKELEDKNNLLLIKQRSLELEARETREELVKKSKEVDEGMELQDKLLLLIQSKASLMLQKEKELKEQVKKTNELLEKIESLERNVNTVQEQLNARTDEAQKEKELQEKLQKEIELHVLNNANNEQLINNYETGKKLLTGKIQSLEESMDGLQQELRKKIEEVEAVQKLHERLLQQFELNNLELLKTGRQLEELEREKKLLLVKLKCLEERVDKLHLDLRERNNETSEEMQLHGKLLQRIEAKDSELLSEKKKNRDAVAAYKRLKSEYNFLLKKFNLNTERVLPKNGREDESDSLGHNGNPDTTSPDNQNVTPNAMMVASDAKRNLDDFKEAGLIQRPSSDSPSASRSPVVLNCSTSHSPAVPNCSSDAKSGSLAGTKRPVSSWRDTRTHQQRGGLDPHDDFLDTPLENLKKAIKEEVRPAPAPAPAPAPKDMTVDSSNDDETQDPALHKLQVQDPIVPRPGPRGFKYVEPVRKKAERENLKGIECKQCKKFYDAVLPDGGGEGQGSGSNRQQLRCEHHSGVSRHRYRYEPPSTPEGFWNIGFESEM